MLDGEIDAKDATTLPGAITALLGAAAKKYSRSRA